MREKAEAVMRANKDCMSDHFSTIRNGHVCIPVKKEYKFKISGILIDKSSTGSTLFIEPSASAKYYEELQELRMDEENEVRRILYELTALVAENGEIMTQNIRMMEKLDFIFSRGKLSESYHGTEPKIIEERRIYLRYARHPLMDRDICVPLQFSLGEGVRGIVITGPNTGGKTVAIKTVALSCLMAQCGLHVACEEAEICMNRNILCDIGDGQNLSENLSTFSAHIVNMLDILKRVIRYRTRKEDDRKNQLKKFRNHDRMSLSRFSTDSEYQRDKSCKSENSCLKIHVNRSGSFGRIANLPEKGRRETRNGRKGHSGKDTDNA